jgi:hypothetical protein
LTDVSTPTLEPGRRRRIVLAGALVLAVLLAWPWLITSWSTRAHLTVVGLTLELTGLALVAVDFWWPWLVPHVQRLGRDAAKRTAAAVARASERLRRTAERMRGRRTVRAPAAHAGAAGLNMALETNVAGKVTPGKAPSTAELVRRLHETEGRLRAVEERQDRETRELRAELAAVTEVVRDMIRRSKDEYLGWRIVGLAIGVAGAGCLAASNLV